MNVTVVVATCGSDEWKEMGDEAARGIYIPSIVRVHLPKGTVAQARNEGLKQVKTEFICFVDADDTISHGYFGFDPTSDVTVTSIRYRYRGIPMIPRVWQHENGRPGYHTGDCVAPCLVDGNWVHVGAIIRTDAIKSIGGFKEYAVYEDWALMLELQQNGFTFDRRPESVYEASIRQNDNHRNRSLPTHARNLIHEQIYRDIVK